MDISVVIGTHNRLERLQACLDSIFDQTRRPTTVYVTDAGSTDGTVEYLQASASDRLVPVLVGERLGQARAYNQVFELVGTAYTCWLSDDNVVVNRSLDLAAHILDEHPTIGMVGLKTRDVVGPFADAPYLGAVSAIGVLNVNQGLLRTAVLREVGGFSEAFRDYGIDPDLTAKVLLRGHDVVYTRAVAIHHYRAWTEDAERNAQFRDKQRTYLDLYWKKYAQYAQPDVGWAAKRRLWTLLRAAFRIKSINSYRFILGMIARDWSNILTGRYISLLDPLICLGKPYHLVQSCPASRRLHALPADPDA